MGLKNELIVFRVKHLFFDVVIKGVLDMDFFEEPNQIQYVNDEGDRQLSIPQNPYEPHSDEWEAYQHLERTFEVDENLIDLLTECTSIPETHQFENYTIEMESLTW